MAKKQARGRAPVDASGEAARFLDEIYADPDDDDLRRVYGDWLLERGDPRGELIALQLAPARTEAMARREASLLKQHGKRWAGILDRYLTPEGRIWRRGFLAGGLPTFDMSRGVLPPALSEPAWSTMEELGVPWTLATHREALALELVELPWVRALRALRGIHVATAAAVLLGEPRPRLREVAVTLAGREEGLRDALAGGDAVPNLEHLSINARPEVLPWLLATPLARRIARFTGWHHQITQLGPWIAAVAHEVAAHALPLRELAFDHKLSRARDTPWCITAMRDDAGRFRRLRAVPVGASTLPDRAELVRALASLPDDGLAELVVPPTRTNTYSANDIAAVEAALARFRGARIEVPWPRLARTPTLTVALDVAGRGWAKDASLAALWDRVHELPRAPVFDAWEVDARGHRALPAGGLGHVRAALTQPRTMLVRVYESTGAAELRLHRASAGARAIQIRCALADEPAAIDAYLAWVTALLDERVVEQASLPFTVPVGDEAAWRLGWLELFRRLPDAVRALAWLRAIETRSGTLLVIGPSPHRPPSPAQQAELAGALRAADR